MANSPITLTDQQLTALVQERYPNVVVTGLSRAYNPTYGGGTRFEFATRAKLDPNNPIWTSADGRQIPVGEMVITHAQNALAKVIRNDYGFADTERQFWIDAFVARLSKK